MSSRITSQPGLTPAGGPPAAPRPDTRIAALDGLRGLAIVLVLVYHGSRAAGSTVVDRFVAFWGFGGWVGVDLFFVLSGFLITGILLDTKGSSSYFKSFYARRFLRIFPLYYAVLTGLLVILPRIPMIQSEFGALAGDEAWYWVYLSNFSLGLQHADAARRLDVFWSLAIEEQFYLLWPAHVLLLSRRWLARLCLAAIVGAAALRLIATLAGVHPMTIYVLTPFRVDGLAAGALLALIVREQGGLARLLRWTQPVAWSSAALLLGVGLWYGRLSPFDRGMQAVGYSALVLLFAALLARAVGSDARSRFVHLLEHPTLRMFGGYSYAIYLFHVPMILALEALLYGPGQFHTLLGSALPGQLVFYALSIGLPLAAAWLSWRLFEAPFLSLKRFFPYRPAGGQQAQGTGNVAGLAQAGPALPAADGQEVGRAA